MIEENKIDPEFDYEEKGDLTDHLVEPAHKPELSPNPQGSGYLKQVKVNSLPLSGQQVDVLYILPDGRQFKWNNSLAQYVRVENGPAYLKSKGQHGTPVHENTKPGVPPRVFPDSVSFLNDVFVKGKKLEDYIDSQGGVTEEELQAALLTKQNILVSGENIKTVGGTTILGSGNIPLPEEPDSDVSVQISTDGGSTYGTAISLQTFIANCELGTVYTTPGTIARISNCINGGTFRFILIGVNHDVLANTDEGGLEPSGTKAKTTWQFYDMPVQKVNLGLPFEEEKQGYVRCDQTGDLEDCPEIIIDKNYPSNMHGYTSAVGLLNALQCIFDSLPQTLQKALKLVRKDCFISEIENEDYGTFGSTSEMIKQEGDRYGSAVAQKLFCLSAYEMGYVKDETNPVFPTTIETEIDDEPTAIKLEGSKYAYFEEGNGSTAIAKRIRYFGGSAWFYWLRSPYVQNSNGWGYVNYNGGISYSSTSNDYGVAPAFCI